MLKSIDTEFWPSKKFAAVIASSNVMSNGYWRLTDDNSRLLSGSVPESGIDKVKKLFSSLVDSVFVLRCIKKLVSSPLVHISLKWFDVYLPSAPEAGPEKLFKSLKIVLTENNISHRIKWDGCLITIC